MYALNRLLTFLILCLGLVSACAGSEHVTAAADANADPGRSEGDTRSEQPGGLSVKERAQLEQMARETLDRLVAESESARELFERSKHYAVFDSAKVGALVTGAGGSGVAVDTRARQCVYMHMGAAGLGLGGGIQKYKIVFLFEDDDAFGRFVEGHWDGNTTAQAVAGKAAVEAASNFVDGLAVYQLTDAGLIAQADLTLMKFWQDRDAANTYPEALRCAS